MRGSMPSAAEMSPKSFGSKCGESIFVETFQSQCRPLIRLKLFWEEKPDSDVSVGSSRA